MEVCTSARLQHKVLLVVCVESKKKKKTPPTSIKRQPTTTCGRDWTNNRGTRPERGYCWRACKLEDGSSCEDGEADGRRRRDSGQGLGTKKPSNTTQKAGGKIVICSTQHAQHASTRVVCRPRTACTLETTRRRVATVGAGSVYPAIVITAAHAWLGYQEPHPQQVSQSVSLIILKSTTLKVSPS
jgi:hypothetical protein